MKGEGGHPILEVLLLAIQLYTVVLLFFIENLVVHVWLSDKRTCYCYALKKKAICSENVPTAFLPQNDITLKNHLNKQKSAVVSVIYFVLGLQ